MFETVQKYRTLIGIVLIILILAGGGLLIYTQQDSAPIQVSETAVAGQDIQAAQDKVIVVDIKGAVTNPGVYELDMGSRVQDAIDAAGGLTAEADIDRFGLSRAAMIQDEQLITIPQKQDNQVQDLSAPSASSNGCISVNQASVSQLDSLPGIGEARAGTIIENRPYANTSELVSKKAIPQSVYDEIKDQICI